MITASVSLSPIVVAIAVAENQVQQRISTKILTDELAQSAELISQIVTEVSVTDKESSLNRNRKGKIDFHA